VNAIVWGAAAGIALAFAWLAFGIGGFVLVAVFGIVGGVAAAVWTGRLNLRAAVDAARGRRVG
jgi:hypothetical protein